MSYKEITMEKDVVISLRISAEMKAALTKHAKEYFELPVGQVIRWLIANELSDEGVKLKKPWISIKPIVKKELVVETIPWTRNSNKSKGAKHGR